MKVNILPNMLNQKKKQLKNAEIKIAFSISSESNIKAANQNGKRGIS